MLSKRTGGYLKRIYKVVIWFMITIICFAAVFFLYDLPVSAVGYAALLSGTCGCLLLIFDYRRYAAACKKISYLLFQEYPVPEELPLAFDSLEEEYQQLVKRIYENKIQMEQQSAATYEDLMDYYTLWVHQIKTPISAMNLLLQTDESENVKALSMELFKIEQYTELVLQYLRLGSTVNDFVLQPCDLDDMIRQVLRKYAKMFIGRGISADFCETHKRVLTDEKWMVFVMEQLLSNALKYTPRGVISIYSADENSFTIEDTGIGIAAEDLPRIFEKGYTGFNGRMDKKATGLGLYLSKQILDKLGHKIVAESIPGAGSKFTVTF
ncbi:MAG: sensor histidine kinase [Eubacteriales bacterium]|nr:sensor histidine kinase [Eubacteriales bacterium]